MLKSALDFCSSCERSFLPLDMPKKRQVSYVNGVILDIGPALNQAPAILGDAAMDIHDLLVHMLFCPCNVNSSSRS